MSDTIDLVLQVKAQSDQAKTEIAKVIESLQALRNSSENATDRAALEQQIQLYKNMAVEIDKSARALDGVDVKSKLQAVKEFAEKFKDATKELKAFADGSVEAARAIAMQEKIIKNTSAMAGKSAEDTKKTLEFIKEYSMSKQPFKTEDIYQASAQLNKFRLSIQETLPLVANLAATFDNDLVRASKAVSWAMTDTGRGVSILQKEYGITREVFKQYEAEMTATGEVETNSIKTKEALVKMLQEMSVNADKASNSYGAALNQYNNQVTALKVQIGQNLLPLLTGMTQKATELFKVMEKYPGLTQSAIALGSAVLGIVAVGVPLAGTVATIAGAGIKILAVVQELGGMSAALAGLTGVIGTSGVAALRFAGIWGIVAAAVGTATKAYLDYQAALSVKEQEKTAEVLNQQVESLNKFASVYGKLLSPMEAIRTVQEDIIKGGVKWGETAEGQQKIAVGLELVNSQLVIAKSNLEQYEKKFQKEGFSYDLSLQIDATKKYIQTLDDAAAGLDKFKTQVNDTKSFEGVKNTFAELQNSFKSMGKWEFKVSDEDLQKFIKQQEGLIEAGRQTNSKMLANLTSYKEKYKLTKEQELEIDKKIVSAKEKVASDEDKKLQDRKKKQEDIIKGQSSAWDSFLTNLKLSLTQGDISEKEFYEKVKKYLSDHTAELKNNAKLKLEIQDMYYKGVGSLAEKSAQDEKERQAKALQEEKDRKQIAIQAGKELIAEEEKARDEADKKAKEAEDKRIEANKELNKTLLDLGQSSTEKMITQIQEQADKFREAKAEEVKIEEFTQKSLQKLQTETAEQFKQKEEEKRAQIQETLKSIQDIEKKQEENREKRDEVVFGFDNTSPVMSMAEAFDPKRKTKWDKASELDKENMKLEDEKQQYQSKLAKQKDEEKKLTEELEKAQTALNVALGVTETAYNAISKSSPWDAEIQKLNSAIAAAKEYNSVVSSGSGGGSSSPTGTVKGGGAISTPSGQAGVTDSLGTATDYLPRLTTMLSGVVSTLNSASSVVNNSNTNIDNRNNSSQASTVNNHYTVNVDGRSTVASEQTKRAVENILTLEGSWKYRGRRNTL